VNTILTFLAVAGIAAAVWHVVRAAFRFLGHGAAGIWSRELARTHARRGDVTALEDARREGEEVARRKTRAVAEAIGWLILLLAPPLTPWARHIYAAYTLLWLVPAVRSRRS
jgi:hypothetical protein